MIRSIANLDLSIGLVNVPIKMVGVSDSHDRKSSMYHHHADGEYGKVRMPKMCEGCGEIVPTEGIAKGYEHNGGIVMLSDDELKTIAANTSTSMEISGFIKRGSVDPMIYAGENIYRLIPDPKRGRQAVSIYRLLIRKLVEDELIGVASYIRWGRNRLAHIDVEPTKDGGVLIARNMLWADELRPAEFPVLDGVDDSVIDQRLWPVASQMIDSMITDWKPESYTDTYVDALCEAIEAKASGAEIVAVSDSQTSGGVDDVADILARLEQSIKVKEDAEKPVAKKAAPKKAAAPRRKAS
jgi:DNA end-binding protein Ku